MRSGSYIHERAASSSMRVDGGSARVDENYSFLSRVYESLAGYVRIGSVRNAARLLLRERHRDEEEEKETSSRDSMANIALRARSRSTAGAEAEPEAMGGDVFWCCTPRFETACFALCALNTAPLGGFVRSAMEASLKEISYFITDTAAYIVSKMWDDMLASELFKINTLFLCSEKYDRPCNQPAPTHVQFEFSFTLLAACALIKTWIETRASRNNRGTLIVPTMLGMLVGWSFGRAFLELRVDAELGVFSCAKSAVAVRLDDADLGLGVLFRAHDIADALHLIHHPPSPAPPPPPVADFANLGLALTPHAGAAPPVSLECIESASSPSFRIMYALAVTCLSALLILLLEPAAMLEKFGTTGCRRRVGVQFSSFVQLLSKAAATTSMIVWNDALAYSVTAGIGEEQPEVKQRTLLLYSLTMTFAGSAVSMQFQSWSRHLTTLSEASARSAQRHAAAKREFAAAGRNSAVSDRSSAGDPDLLRKLGRKIRRLRLRVHFAAVSLRFLVVLEGTLGWVAGCAWTDYTVALYPSIGEFPVTPPNTPLWNNPLVDNVKVALVLSALALVYITFTGNSAAKGARESRERIFIGGAFSFLSGWAWIAVVRCIWALPYAQRREAVQGYLTDDTRYGVEVTLALLFCPLFTWLVIRAALYTKNAYERRAGMTLWRRHVMAIRTWVRARRNMQLSSKRRGSPPRSASPAALPELLL